MIRDHERAALAHDHVEAIGRERDERIRRAYGAHCHKLAILVHQAGLAAALHHTAQLDAPKPLLVEHLALQVHRAGLLPRVAGAPRAEDLLAATREAGLGDTWQLTREVQRCLEWYRRLAHGLLGVAVADDPERT